VGGRVGLFALALGVLLSTGCGGSSSSDTAQLRVFHAAAGVSAVNVLIDGSIVAGNLNYGAATNYLTVKAGSIHVQAAPASGGSPVLDQTISISASAHQTLVMTGSNSIVLTDGGTTAVTGDGHVRVFNASNSMGPSDVYIVNPGTGLTGATPVTKNLAFGSGTGYQAIPLGNYEVFLTQPGTTTVNLATGPLNLGTSNSTNQTVVVFDASSGGFTYILLTDQ
jgi:Domain of unknown function (DUF4397)